MTRDIKNSGSWSFETRQIHIGQEKADPATDSRAVPIYAGTSYVFTTATTRRTDLPSVTREIYTAD